MQALGAFGFLGLKKGLKPFIEHIPAAFHNLHLAAANVPSLSYLLQLTRACQKVIDPT
jgi:hypothetical protein